MQLTRLVPVSSLSLVLLTTAAHAAITADAVVSYDAGTGAKTAYWGAPLNLTSSALGLPASNHNLADTYDGDGNQITYADHSVLSPFNAAYTPGEVVSFGAGGHLTLHLSAPVNTSGGPTLGIHTGTGLNSVLFSNGQNLSPAETYTDPRTATVEISADNATWFTLGTQTFNLPSNFYTAGLSGPYDLGPGSASADFSKPFTGALADFSGLDWQGTLNLLNNSAGGTWLDLSSATGPGALPSSIQYVRFSLPQGSPSTFVLDSLTAVPEPTTLLAACGLAFPLLTRRRTSK